MSEGTDSSLSSPYPAVRLSPRNTIRGALAFAGFVVEARSTGADARSSGSLVRAASG